MKFLAALMFVFLIFGYTFSGLRVKVCSNNKCKTYCVGSLQKGVCEEYGNQK